MHALKLASHMGSHMASNEASHTASDAASRTAAHTRARRAAISAPALASRLIPALALLLAVASGSARADIDAGRKLAEQACAGCHGADGNAPGGGVFPILAGQTFRYLTLELRDYKAGRRTDPVMSQFAQQLSADDIVNLSEYFAAQKYKPIDFTADPARVERGGRKAAETLCTMCHLGSFGGSNEIPRVAGQYPDYIVKQLRAFKARTRHNDAGSMTSVAQTLSDDDMVDLANYIANLQ
jgi:cytochrome c553